MSPVKFQHASTIIPHLLTRMQKMQQLMVQMQANQSGGGGQTNNRNTCRPPTFQAATKTRQGQPHKPLLYFATKYFWTHGKCTHEGAACKNKAPKHQGTLTSSNKFSGSTYGCTWQGGLKKIMVLSIDNKINLICQTIKIVVEPPPSPILTKADTGSTAHYFTPADAHALFNILPNSMGPQVRLPDNISMNP